MVSKMHSNTTNTYHNLKYLVDQVQQKEGLQVHHLKYKLMQPKWKCKKQQKVVIYYQDLREFSLLTENFDERINTSYNRRYVSRVTENSKLLGGYQALSI